MTDGERVRVAALCGSLRPGSHTRMALAVALEGAAELGAATELLDLREYELAFCCGDDDEDAGYPEDVERLRRAVRSAEGILLGTPEYHGSYSGVLKNALDLMGFDEFEGKVVGLVGVAGGRMGATNALNHLRAIGRSLHAWVVPQEVSIAQAWREFDDAGAMKDPKLAERVRGVGREVARFAYLHHSEAGRDFLREWETAMENPGG